MAKEIIKEHRLRDAVIRLNNLKIDKKSDNLAEMMEWMGIQPGHSLYSSVYGPVVLLEVNEQKIKVKDKSDNIFEFTLEGKLHEEGEVVLFPTNEKVWKSVPISVSPPRKREFTGYGTKYMKDSEITENAYKFLGFMASTATEIDDLFDKVIKCESIGPFMKKDQKNVYTIDIREERNHEKNKDEIVICDIQIDKDDKGVSLRVPPFFCFSSYAALLYFLHEYRIEIMFYIRGLYRALNYPHPRGFLPFYSEKIERDILEMIPMPYSAAWP